MGKDFTETFAPVAHITSLRLIIAVAAARHLPILTNDINSAFLNAPLDEEIYIEQPVGFHGNGDKVRHLNKALYGLRQSACAWYIELAQKLSTIHFTHSSCDHSIFYQYENDNWCILTIHTDDITGICNSDAEIARVKNEISTFWKFKEKDTKHKTTILGILVKHLTSGKYKYHNHHILKMLYNNFKCLTQILIPCLPILIEI